MIDVLLLTVGAGMTFETRQGLKPRKACHSAARLKPCPDTKRTLGARIRS